MLLLLLWKFKFLFYSIDDLIKIIDCPLNNLVSSFTSHRLGRRRCCFCGFLSSTHNVRTQLSSVMLIAVLFLSLRPCRSQKHMYVQISRHRHPFISTQTKAFGRATFPDCSKRTQILCQRMCPKNVLISSLSSRVREFQYTVQVMQP